MITHGAGVFRATCDDRAMRVGMSPFGTSREGVLELARAAVDGGLDTLWLGDGLLANEDFPAWSGGMETFCELAWLAGSLPTARIGITAAVLPLRDPVWVVKQAATLDNLTQGGFVFVVTPGFWEREFDYRGLEFTRRGDRFAEAIEAVRAGLAGDPHDGEHFRLPADGRLSPVPVTPGGPPIWLAGGPATMRRALAMDLPFQASRATPDELAITARAFFDGGGTVLAHRVRVQLGEPPAAGHNVDWHAVSGSVEALVDQLGRFAELGVSDLSIAPGADEASNRATIEALATEVLPRLGWT